MTVYDVNGNYPMTREEVATYMKGTDRMDFHAMASLLMDKGYYLIGEGGTYNIKMISGIAIGMGYKVHKTGTGSRDIVYLRNGATA